VSEFFDKALVERRSLEHVLSDLCARYERRPDPELAEKIQNLKTEISHRGGGTQGDRARPVLLSRYVSRGKIQRTYPSSQPLTV
jgi:hypothetical protein